MFLLTQLYSILIIGLFLLAMAAAALQSISASTNDCVDTDCLKEKLRLICETDPKPDYLDCQALVDSSILNAKILPPQMQTQTVIQPTQAIQSTAVDANNCRSSEFEDGMNSGFNVNTWINYDADQWMYYGGFVSGCTYYDVFTVDYCENWANSSIK
jgi:hypothetical protein